MRVKESISIIIPAYNEEKSIKDVVDLSFKVLPALTNDYEVVVVDDASSDGTYQVLEKLQKKYSNLKVIRNKKNLGTGGSLKILYKTAKKNLSFFIPADNQIRATELPKFLKKIEKYDLVNGWGKKGVYPFYRRFLSKLYNLVLKVLLETGMKDADSVKLIRRKVLETIKLEAESGFVDAELIVKARKHNFRLAEIEIKRYPRATGKASGLKTSVVLKKIMDLIRYSPKLIFYEPKKSYGKTG